MTGSSPAIRAAVFDLDGVLVDSFAVMREAFARAYAEAVGPGEAPFAEYTRHLGRYFPEIMRLMGLPAAMEEPFVRESRRLAHLVTVYDRVPEMLAALRSGGLWLGVATGKSGERARALLASVGLGGAVDLVVGSDEVARPKPAPDILRACLRGAAVPPPEAAYVGDAPVDMQSARAAGVRAVAALWGGEGGGEALLAERPNLACQWPEDVVAACTGGKALSHG